MEPGRDLWSSSGAVESWAELRSPRWGQGQGRGELGHWWDTALEGWVTGQQLGGLGGRVRIAAVAQTGRVQWLIDDPGR